MSCEPFGLLISKWVDGEAEPEEVRRVEAHIASCPSCRRLAEEFRRNEGLVESAFGPEPFGQQVAGGVLGSIARRETLLRWGARLAVAAGLLAAFLVFRADREQERREFVQRVDAALRVVEGMNRAAPPRDGEPRLVEREIVREFYPVAVREGKRTDAVAYRPIGPPPDHGTAEAPKGPEPRPGTIAMDRVDALPDHETGSIALNWRMDRTPGAVYFVYRREVGETAFGAPLNPAALPQPRFEDSTALALTTYEYQIIAMAEGTPVPANVLARVTTPPDLQIRFLGLVALDKKPAALLAVHVRRNGAWREQTFAVEPGGLIGEPIKDVDFSTGFRLERIEKVLQPYKLTGSDQWLEWSVWRATLSTPQGTIQLWNGESALGSRERVDLVELPATR